MKGRHCPATVCGRTQPAPLTSPAEPRSPVPFGPRVTGSRHGPCQGRTFGALRRAPERRCALYPPARFLVVLAFSGLAVAGLVPAGASERSEAARRGAEYLVQHQAEDGTFFADNAPHRVAEALAALVAGGVSGVPISRALSFIEAAGPEAAKRAGEAGLLVMGIFAAGENPHNFRGDDYAARLHSFYNGTIGAYDTQMFQNALALLGVVAAGEVIPERAVTFLRLNRCTDGGIPVQAPCGGGGGHVDVTALVLNALARSGMPPSDSLRSDARAFLISAQNDQGGFGDGKDKPTNSNSTGLSLSAISAVGESASQAPWRLPSGGDPLNRLLALQQPDGRFRFTATIEGDSFLATRQAIPGVSGRTYPVVPNPPSSTKSGSPADGGSRPSSSGNTAKQNKGGGETSAQKEPETAPASTPVISAEILDARENPARIEVVETPDRESSRKTASLILAGSTLAVSTGGLLLQLRARSHGANRHQ